MIHRTASLASLVIIQWPPSPGGRYDALCVLCVCALFDVQWIHCLGVIDRFDKCQGKLENPVNFAGNTIGSRLGPKISPTIERALRSKAPKPDIA